MSPNPNRGGPQALMELKQHLRARWQALASRERRAVGTAALALFLLGLWFVALRPAWQVLRDAPAQRAALDAQLTEMRSLAADALSELAGLAADADRDARATRVAPRPSKREDGPRHQS